MKQKKLIIILCIIVFLLFPFKVDKISLSSSEIKIYKAAVYSVVRVNVFGITKTKVYLFPSNFDANNNYKVVSGNLKEVENSLTGLFNY